MLNCFFLVIVVVTDSVTGTLFDVDHSSFETLMFNAKRRFEREFNVVDNDVVKFYRALC